MKSVLKAFCKDTKGDDDDDENERHNREGLSDISAFETKLV